MKRAARATYYAVLIAWPVLSTFALGASLSYSRRATVAVVVIAVGVMVALLLAPKMRSRPRQPRVVSAANPARYTVAEAGEMESLRQRQIVAALPIAVDRGGQQ